MMKGILMMSLIISSITVSGCLNNADYEREFDIDFSYPEEKISVPPKDARIYHYEDDIAIKTSCKDWDVYSQRNADTNSMDPTFDSGHALIACKLDGYNPQIGEIVVFNRKEGNPITHRIIDIEGYNYTIKGDNLNEVEYINKSQITHYILGVIF